MPGRSGHAHGRLFRQYWIPAIRSDELPSLTGGRCACDLLGEDLIGFRDDAPATVGLVQNNCPHRGASLFFGRNEEEGLRCVYHGWKFDITGRCVDMPNEPAESNFKDKVHARAYPTRERGRHHLGLHGPARGAAAAARHRGEHAGQGTARDLRAVPPLQLDAGLGGRDGHRPRGLPALRRATARRTQKPAPSTTISTAIRAGEVHTGRHGLRLLQRRLRGRPATTASTGASRRSSSPSTT